MERTDTLRQLDSLTLPLFDVLATVDKVEVHGMTLRESFETYKRVQSVYRAVNNLAQFVGMKLGTHEYSVELPEYERKR